MQRVARLRQSSAIADILVFVIRNKSSPRNFTQYAALPHNIEIVKQPQITATPLHHMYIPACYSACSDTTNVFLYAVYITLYSKLLV